MRTPKKRTVKISIDHEVIEGVEVKYDMTVSVSPRRPATYIDPEEGPDFDVLTIKRDGVEVTDEEEFLSITERLEEKIHLEADEAAAYEKANEMERALSMWGARHE